MISTEALFETMGRDELEGGGYLLYYIYILRAYIRGERGGGWGSDRCGVETCFNTPGAIEY